MDARPASEERRAEVLSPVRLERADAAAVDQQAQDHADKALAHVSEHDREQEDEHDRHERRGVDRAVQRDAVGEDHAVERPHQAAVGRGYRHFDLARSDLGKLGRVEDANGNPATGQ